MREKIKEIEKELKRLQSIMLWAPYEADIPDDVVWMLDELGIEAELAGTCCFCSVANHEVVYNHEPTWHVALRWNDGNREKHYVCLTCLRGAKELIDYLKEKSGERSRKINIQKEIE